MKTKLTWNKKVTSIMLVAALVFSVMPWSALKASAAGAVTIGDFTIEAADGITTLTEGTDYSYSKTELTITTTKPIILGMKSGVTTTANTVVVSTANGVADVTLDNISIDNAEKYYALQIEDGNPCTLRLQGTSTIKNTYGSGSAIRTFDKGTSVNITAVDANGKLNVTNTGSNGAIYASGKGNLTVDGYAVLNVNSENHVGINECGLTTIKGNANVTVAAKKDAIICGSDNASGIVIDENAQVTVTKGESGMNASGVYGQNILIGGNAKVTVSGISDKGIENAYGAITIKDNAIISVTGGDFGIFNNYYEKPLNITDNVQVTLTDNAEFGIKNDGTITISDRVKINISGTDEGIYSADGSINISGNADITVKNCDSWGILGSAQGLKISDDVKITAENAGSALRTGSKDTSNIEISGNVVINITGGDDGIQHSGKVGTTFVIKDNVKINITNIKDDAIYSSNAKTTIGDNVEIKVDGCATGIYNGAADDQPFELKGNAKVSIDKTTDTAIDGYGTLSVSGNAVLKHTNGASKEYGSENDIVVSENGEVTISAVDKKVLYGTYKVIPNAGKVFEVKTGKDEASAEATYYNTEKSEEGKSTWYYFYAKSRDIVAAPAIVWPEASAITFGDTLSDSTLTSTDENGTFAWKDTTIAPQVSDSNKTTYEVVYTPKNTILYDYTGVELTKGITLTVNEAVAPTTENTEKVKDVTNENVKLEDEENLQNAKQDLEAALNNDDYNAEEKKAIQKEIDRIDEALKAIDNVEAIEKQIEELPETVKPDDEETLKKIEEAKNALDALTDHEESLVSQEKQKKLDELLKAMVDYKIIEGAGSVWTIGNDGGLNFKANGAYSKFAGIKIDDKEVDAKNYTAKSGSTIITLKAEYLDTLSVGTHKITIVYIDGEASADFKVEAKKVVETGTSDKNSPTTGDYENTLIWIAVAAVSGMAIVAAEGYKRRVRK